jgi:hypothetical protein
VVVLRSCFASLPLALLIATAAVIGQTYRRPSGRRLAGAPGAGVLGVLQGASTMHACGNGQAFTQWMIPIVCMALGVAFIGPSWPRRAVVSASLILSILLTGHYLVVVHGPELAGTQDAERLAGPTRRE